MSFSLRVKTELLNQEFNEEKAIFFVQGVFFSSMKEDNADQLRTNFKNANVFQAIIALLEKLNVEFSTNTANFGNEIILKNGDILPKEVEFNADFLAGCFLSGGSISNIDSTSYHLEIKFWVEKSANQIINHLSKHEFSFSSVERRKKHVIYLKKSMEISDFLKFINARNSVLEFEDVRIRRDYKNFINRYSNLDIYNQQKLSVASVKFEERLKYIKENNLTNLFSEKELNFFEIKKQNMYSSLAELAEIYNEYSDEGKTKSGLNHWLIKLRKICEDN